MKYILCQPAQLRFQWELEVVLTNILSLNKNAEICVLFAHFGRESVSVIEHITSRYPQVEVHTYEDRRDDKSYVSSIRSFLWWCYLSEDPEREKDTYFYIDADIIFRELPDFSKLGADVNTYVGSDCGGYLDYGYLSTRKNGTEVIRYFATLTNLTEDDIKSIPGAGAQWYLTEPTAEMWLKIYHDCNNIWRWFQPLDSDIQKWTAEMWAYMYNFAAFGKKVVISPELDFCLPTDNIKMWDSVKIMHNAGVLPDMEHMLLFKGKYTHRTPMEDDLSFVRRDKVGIKYVDAIKMVEVCYNERRNKEII